MFVRVFFCAAERTNAEFEFSNPKICTFVFCGSAACCHEPSSERKVSRVSVTEGARGTERWPIFLFSHRRRTPNRLPSFKEGSCRRRRLRGVEGSEGSNFAAEQPQMNFCEFRCFQVNPSGAPRQLPLHKGAYEFVRFSALCRRENRGKSKSFKPENSRKTQVAHSPSVASRQLPLRGSL